MANYTTTQLQLTRNYLDGDIKGESIVAPDIADQDFVVEDNGDQVTQPAAGEAGCVDYDATNPYENEYRNNADDLIIDNVSLSNPSGALAGDVDGDSDFASRRDVRDYNHGNRSNWDVICDVGTAIKQTSAADALTNYRPEGIGLDHPVFEDGALERHFDGEGWINIVAAEGQDLFHGLDAGGMNYTENDANSISKLSISSRIGGMVVGFNGYTVDGEGNNP